MGWPEAAASIAGAIVLMVFFCGWPKIIIEKKCKCKCKVRVEE